MVDPDLWPIGVFIYILGTFMGGLGANLQRKAFLQEQDMNPETTTVTGDAGSVYQQKLFVCGLTLFICSGIFMSIALIFTTQTSLAPLLLLLLIFNAFFASIVNKERIDWYGIDGLAMIIVVAGVSLAIVASPKKSQTYTIEQAKHLMESPGFISFFTCTCGAIAIIFTAKLIIEKRNMAQEERSAKVFQYISYGTLSGLFGGLNITSTKLIFAILTGTTEHSSFTKALESVRFWLIAVFLVTTYVLQVLVSVEGLEFASAIIVMSAHSVIEEITASLGGIVCYGDAKKFKEWEWLSFMFGNILAIIGVLLLADRRIKHIEEAEEESRLLVENTLEEQLLPDSEASKADEEKQAI